MDYVTRLDPRAAHWSSGAQFVERKGGTCLLCGATAAGYVDDARLCERHALSELVGVTARLPEFRTTTRGPRGRIARLFTRTRKARP